MLATTKITGVTNVVTLIGNPVGHSFSPVMHNAAFSALGLDYVYVALPVEQEDVSAAISGLKALNFVGANVTMPHKETVRAYLDDLTPSAHAIGAVNTIFRQEGKLVGHNTDGEGLIQAIKEKGQNVKGRRAFLLGAGGAAQAVAMALALAGVADVAITNRTAARAERLVERIRENTSVPAVVVPWNGEVWAGRIREADIIINATSAGMAGQPSFAGVLPWSDLKEEAMVCDLVYHPLETELLQNAQVFGLTTVNGLDLLLHQGALAFKLWTKREAPLDVMRDALGAKQEKSRF